MAAAAAAAGAAVPVVTGQQQALFASKHAELVSEARAVAREHGVTVCTVAFCPDGTGVAHELIGASREERLRDVIVRAVARDVSEMGPREVVGHHMQLHALRAFVLRELQAKKETAAAAAAAAAAAKDDGAGAAKTKRALEKKKTDGGGAAGNAAKSRRTD